ncbi:HNH endonuclease [Mycobacterium phage Deenasa]|nr:HNH endonuclease [Mycobacterium phage Deenasa]
MSASDWIRWRRFVAAPNARGCRLWQGSTSGFGHGQFRWRGKLIGAHKLAWRLANDGAEIPAGLVVRHRCHYAGCVEGSHLRLGTQADNVADMLDAGRAVVGEAHYAAKLTEHAVRAARDLYAEGGWSIIDLATRFGVTDMTMRDVLVGKSWRHITGGVPVTPPKTPRLTDEDRKTIIALREAGWTQKAIAAEIGRSITPVVQTLYRAGMKQPRVGHP